MQEAPIRTTTSGGPAGQLVWVLHQPRGRRYRTRAPRAGQHHLHLTRLEQNREYQRLLACLVRLSETFQRSLSAEQRRTWLTFEDALSDHAWFLHAYYFKAGYDLGKATTRRRRAAQRPPGSDAFREHAVLLSALAKLLERLVALGPPR